MNNILITGLPGAGKTTLIKRLCIIFKEFNPVGFVTDEVMEEGNITGSPKKENRPILKTKAIGNTPSASSITYYKEMGGHE